MEFWGHTPGNYNIDSTETYKVYGYSSKNPEDILLVDISKEESFKLEKKYENIKYSVIVSLFSFIKIFTKFLFYSDHIHRRIPSLLMSLLTLQKLKVQLKRMAFTF